jgi:hypothetical protein
MCEALDNAVALQQPDGQRPDIANKPHVDVVDRPPPEVIFPLCFLFLESIYMVAMYIMFILSIVGFTVIAPWSHAFYGEKLEWAIATMRSRIRAISKLDETMSCLN